MRHAGVLSALLLTAALLCAMPGLVHLPQDADRADERLRPARLRTLTVWLMPGDVGDRRLINEACAAFEKERDGVRIFLRVVTADEFIAENAVLPDVALFETGDIAVPEQVFVPLADDLGASGRFAGVQRAAALWLAPNVMSLPESWLREASPQTPRPDSLLAAATAVPQETVDSVIEAEDLPWGQLLRKGALEAPAGVGWQQLLAACPREMRPQLVSAVLGKSPSAAVPAPTTAEWSTSLPMSRGASPTPVPPVTTPACVETLYSHQSRLQKGEALVACVLSPAVSDRVRYAALCRDGEDARAFVQFLLGQQAAALTHGLVPLEGSMDHADALTRAVLEAYRAPAALPNAFAHTRQEILSLCADGFARNEDPVETLLRLR